MEFEDSEEHLCFTVCGIPASYYCNLELENYTKNWLLSFVSPSTASTNFSWDRTCEKFCDLAVNCSVSPKHEALALIGKLKSECASFCFESHNFWFSFDEVKGRFRSQSSHHVKISEMGLGVFVDHHHFKEHSTLADNSWVSIIFEHSNQTVVFRSTMGHSCSKMELAYPSMDRTVIVYQNTLGGRVSLFLLYRLAPKLWYRNMNWSHSTWSRTLHVSPFCSEIIGKCAAIRLTFTDHGKVKAILSRLQDYQFHIYWTNVTISMSSKRSSNDFDIDALRTLDVDRCVDKQRTLYAIECLLSRGYRVWDQVSEEFVSLVQDNLHLNGFAEALENVIVNSVDVSQFNNIREALSSEIEKLRVAELTEEEMPQNFRLVGKILLTPSRLIFLTPEAIPSNRILRTKGHRSENFLRVALRDEDGNIIASSPASRHIVKRIKLVLEKGVKVGELQYKFLGCSNSQLRAHCCWLYASDGIHTADTIRNSMGDLSNERCVATYISRLGQAFSTTMDAVDLGLEGIKKETIPDVVRGVYCFTDGIGKISKPLADKVATSLPTLTYTPSAFQIRYGGAKGVLTVDLSLGDKEVIQVRPSMEKFHSPYQKLEICVVARPAPLYLNRQVITLMSGLGIPDEVFVDLQDKMLRHLSKMLIFDSEAVHGLAEAHLGFKTKTLTKHGFPIVTEPFLRSVLLIVFKQRLRDLTLRSRIELPHSDGRMMMGTVDEYGVLEEDEVFVQYSKEVTSPKDELIVLTGDVLVTKNPCFHPGDIRIYKAVDVPELSHLSDCIVFSSKGHRPAPNMISGSDLDGDMYFVTWNKKLLPPLCNQEPMPFPKAEKKYLDHELCTSDMIDFIVDYILNDQLGMIANAHLVHADMQKYTIFSEPCLELAELHSYAVDFPKTGSCPPMQPYLTVRQFPNFMKKWDKPRYTSKKIIGKLFVTCEMLSKQQLSLSDQLMSSTDVKPDPRFLISGFESHLLAAQVAYGLYCNKVNTVMKTYGISHEVELASGFVMRVGNHRGILTKETGDVRELLKAKMNMIRQQFKCTLFVKFGEEEKVMENPPKELLQLVSAFYYVAYSSHSSEVSRCLSFPWIFHSLLAVINRINTNCDLSFNIPANTLGPLYISKSIEQYVEIESEQYKAIDVAVGRIQSMISGALNVSVVRTNLTELGLHLSNHVDLAVGNYASVITTSLPSCLHVSKQTDDVVVLTDASFEIVLHKADSEVHERTIGLSNVLSNSPSFRKLLIVLVNWASSVSLIGYTRHDTISPLCFANILSNYLFQLHDADIQNNLGMHFLSLLHYISSGRVITDHQEVFNTMPEPFCDKMTKFGLHAYHKVCQMLSVLALFDDKVNCDSNRTNNMLVEKLSTEAFSSIVYAEEYHSRRMSDKTGAIVTIKQTVIGNSNALVLEAWGSNSALWNVTQEILKLERNRFVSVTHHRKRTLVHGSHVLMLEKSAEEAQVVFEPYLGETNDNHKNRSCVIPKLLQLTDNGIEFEHFKQSVYQQRQLLLDKYDDRYHGQLRIISRFGRVYLMHTPDSEMSVRQLLECTNGQLNIFHKPFDIRHSFIPQDSRNVEEVKGFLRNSNFEETDKTKKFQAQLLGANRVSTTLVLDENFNYIECRLSDYKWMVADLVSVNGLLDARIQVQSRRCITGSDIDNYEGMKDLANPEMPVIVPDANITFGDAPGIRVCNAFWDVCEFVRYKEVSRYTYLIPTLVRDSRIPGVSFLQRLWIDVNYVCQYSRPHRGQFRDVVPRQEVTLQASLPSLRETAQLNSFLLDFWEFTIRLRNIISNG